MQSYRDVRRQEEGKKPRTYCGECRQTIRALRVIAAKPNAQELALELLAYAQEMCIDDVAAKLDKQ